MTITLPKVHEQTIDGMRLAAVRNKTKDIVVISGSVRGGTNMVPKNKSAIDGVFGELLEAGTRSRTKDELRELLSSLGASISFSVGGDRTSFHAQCLPEDVNTVLELIVECLREPAFPQKELELSKKRIVAGLTEDKTETSAQAIRSLDQILYEEGHPNRSLSLDEAIAGVSSITRADLIALHKGMGRQGLYLAIGGDIDPATALTSAHKLCKTLPEGSYTETKMPLPARRKRQEVLVPIPDKANIDVYLSVRTLITSTDSRFLALKVLLSLLGGGGISTGHLMRTVRERDGLTYGIRAHCSDFADFADGAATVWATFAPSVFKKGVETTRKEIRAFFEKGITAARLEAKKEEMIGKYLIGLSTTDGLVGNVHSILLEKKPLSYLKDYATELQALTLNQVREARDCMPVAELSLAAAGTFERTLTK